MAIRHTRVIRLAHGVAARLEYFYDELLDGLTASPGGAWRPTTDVYETSDEIVIKMAVAGLRPEDVEVLVEGNTVVIRGVRPDRCPKTKESVHRIEIPYGRFERRVRIEAPFDRDGVTYTYGDGFLNVVAPKTPPPEPRRVWARF